MEISDLKHVMIFKKFYSKRAKWWYKKKPQFKYIGSVDLRDARSLKDVLRILREFGVTDGDYQLRPRDKKGFWCKKIADVKIDSGNIYYSGTAKRRCRLARMFSSL